ncbi:DMT family transporter [uncultured Thiothrix sp.]|uniref:DMT family transporter n=1 Tax=uncultured Thiothrix sp. TaxID=223185 RepID=UPI002616D447|nr:DMT family transporter [uncultured Thiothrix sp.]HMT92851.1 DMT family transporter [Thiolinea sp.]
MAPFTSAHFILVLISAIWGSGFVAQRLGLASLEPFSFNAGRFVLATFSLLPIWWFMRQGQAKPPASETKLFWFGSFLAGTVMSIGFAFQQTGLLYTTAGNAGFITSMYIVIVPLLGLLVGQTTRPLTWVGIVLAILGLYALSVGHDFHINRGDYLEFMGAFFWAGHVITLGWLSRRVSDLVGVSVVQFAVAALWSSLLAVTLEQPSWPNYQAALWPLVYSGLIASSLCFTLQIIAQRTVDASVAALILSCESVFALWVGWLFLEEAVNAKQLFGCSLMLAGILISQWPERKLVP